MKYFAFLLLFLIFTTAQAVSATKPYTITWKESDEWIAKESSRKVIAFENACYPSGDFLPRFSVTTPVEDGNSSYKVEIHNPVYVPL
ncbi:MAG: hypothetical protein LBS07_05235, partial [Prevotellaceae bacterium]|nr:hypothetical protein [Prevotellaceae bacterium]